MNNQDVIGSDTDLPVKKVMINESLITCGICLEIMHNSMNITPCNHKFCAACIYEWHSEHENCPTCRWYVMDITRDAMASEIIEAFLGANPGKARSEECKNRLDVRELYHLEQYAATNESMEVNEESQSSSVSTGDGSTQLSMGRHSDWKTISLLGYPSPKEDDSELETAQELEMDESWPRLNEDWLPTDSTNVSLHLEDGEDEENDEEHYDEMSDGEEMSMGTFSDMSDYFDEDEDAEARDLEVKARRDIDAARIIRLRTEIEAREKAAEAARKKEKRRESKRNKRNSVASTSAVQEPVINKRVRPNSADQQ